MANFTKKHEKEIVAREAEARRKKKEAGEITVRPFVPLKLDREMRRSLDLASTVNVLPSRWVR